MKNRVRALTFLFVLSLTSIWGVHNSYASITLIQTFTEKNITGKSEFGSRVSGVGDVNGDDFDDVIVGAVKYNNRAGRAYIYFGNSGSEMDATADVSITGEAGNDQFGFSVSGAGDVNGDDFDDVIVGAPESNSGAGSAYIYFGASTMDNIADVTMTVESTNTQFGYSVSGAGDVNGDNFDDVIVGANRYESQRGRAYIYFGASNMDNIPDLTMTGETEVSWHGTSVSGAGDVNGDSFDDVIVGAHRHAAIGSAYIYFGATGSTMDNTPDVTMAGEGEDNYFGASVSGAGDVNGDSFDDVIVGANAYNPGGSPFTGRAYIYFGATGSTMDPTADVTMTGDGEYNFLGYSVSGAGNVNGDDYDDVIVGARGYDSHTGRAYIYFGAEDGNMDEFADVTLTGEAEGNNFGTSVSGAGDVNGDNFDDVIVGAPYYNSYSGGAYIYFGATGSTMDPTADVTMTGEGTNNEFGYSVSGAGDVNGDNFDDVIVGARYYNSRIGRAYIYFGATGTMDNTADVTLTGEADGNNFGYSVSGAGNVNGDDYDDVIVGARGYDSYTGRAYIFFGASTMDNTADLTMDGEAEGDNFGYSVSGAGNVNGDSFDDVIVGANRYNSNTGSAYIYFGSNTMDNIADVTLTGEAVDNEFGISVSGAGDVNGDDYDDVIVGANRYNSRTGRAFIYFGASTMDITADVIMTGETDDDEFGYSVSGAGDVNGDSFDDVIVGAPYYNTYSGSAYIFFGATGSTMDPTADVTMTGEAEDNEFGISVSGAGDVNGDSFDDVIVGAPAYNSDTGRAYIFFGASTMDNTADVTLTGEAEDNEFGYSVSGAGDVNGDDYGDVIVGAPIQPVNGKVYVYGGEMAGAQHETEPNNRRGQSGIFVIERNNTYTGEVRKWYDYRDLWYVKAGASGTMIIQNTSENDVWISVSSSKYYYGSRWSKRRHIRRLRPNESRQVDLESNRYYVITAYTPYRRYGGEYEFVISGDWTAPDGLTLKSTKIALEDQLDEITVQEESYLNQNFPNPFNYTTSIRYGLGKSSRVILKIYDLGGREIEMLINELQEAGEYEVIWQPKNLPSGMYIYRLQAGEFSETKKLFLKK